MSFHDNFGIVPAELFDHDYLSRNARLVYAVLCRYRDAKSTYCYPSIHRIGQKAACSRSIVTEALRELEAFGIIEKKRRMTGTHYNNSYRLPEPSEWQPTESANEYVEKLTEKKARMRFVRSCRATSQHDELSNEGVPRVSYADKTQVSYAGVTQLSNAGVTKVSYADKTLSDQTDQLNREDSEHTSRRTPAQYEKHQHPEHDVPIGTAQYERLCTDYDESTVNEYIARAVDYVRSTGKRHYDDYAAIASSWMTRDKVQKKPRYYNPDEDETWQTIKKMRAESAVSQETTHSETEVDTRENDTTANHDFTSRERRNNDD